MDAGARALFLVSMNSGTLPADSPATGCTGVAGASVARNASLRRLMTFFRVLSHAGECRFRGVPHVFVPGLRGSPVSPLRGSSGMDSESCGEVDARSSRSKPS